MTGKKTIGMMVVLVALVAVAVMQQKGGRSALVNKSNPDATLLQGIDLNAITEVEIMEGTNRVVLLKKDGKWGVGSLYGYPVDFDKLAKAMRSAAQVKLGKPVRAGNVEVSEFGLDEKARKVVLKAGEATVATLGIGASREASDIAGWANQHFVRKEDSDAIYLVDYDFRPFSETPEDWIEQQILNVRSDDIVAVKSGDVDLKLDGADWKLVGLDEATEEFQSSEANKLRMALQYLNCKSIAETSKSDADFGFTNAVVYAAQTEDGFTYTATLGGEIEGDRYARFAVAYAKPTAPPAPANNAKPEDKDDYQKRLDAFNATCDTHAKKTTDLNAKLAGWTYIIRSIEAADFLIGRDKLAKEKAAEDDRTKEPPPQEEL